ncbi:hypothetical protein KFU94_32255 [Chloroflexi bacterium TSY]|nr:hypothetical protein [Chloroflexi bacterium TSY]
MTQDIIARPGLPALVLWRPLPSQPGQPKFHGPRPSAAVRMESDNLVLLDSADKSLDLPNGQAVATHWTAVAARVGTGLVTSSLNTPLGNDAVELPFKVKPFTVPNRVAAAGRAAPTAVETFDMPINAVTEASKLRLNLSATIAMGLLDDLDSLIDYPYGCVEQTMSRLLPSAVASKTYKDLNIPNPKADQLPDIMTQGLQNLWFSTAVRRLGLVVR